MSEGGRGRKKHECKSNMLPQSNGFALLCFAFFISLSHAQSSTPSRSFSLGLFHYFHVFSVYATLLHWCFTVVWIHSCCCNNIHRMDFRKNNMDYSDIFHSIHTHTHTFCCWNNFPPQYLLAQKKRDKLALHAFASGLIDIFTSWQLFRTQCSVICFYGDKAKQMWSILF